MPGKKRFIEELDKLGGEYAFMGEALKTVKAKLSDHPGFTPDDEQLLLGFKTHLKHNSQIVLETGADLNDYIASNKPRN